MRWIRGILLCAALLVTLVFSVGFFVAGKIPSDTERAVPVSDEVPDRFPVLVFWYSEDDSPHCRVFFHRDLSEAESSISGLGYRVPAQQEGVCRASISHLRSRGEWPDEFPWEASWGKEWNDWGASFSRETLPDDREAYDVMYRYSYDMRNRGWYETDGEHVFPKRHASYYAPELGIYAVPALALWAGSWGTVSAVRKRWRRRARRGDASLRASDS